MYVGILFMYLFDLVDYNKLVPLEMYPIPNSKEQNNNGH